MIYFLISASLVASIYSVWMVAKTHCDRREAHLALAVLPAFCIAILYFEYSPIEKIIAFGILFAAGVTLISEQGLRKIFAVIQIGFALALMIGFQIL